MTYELTKKDTTLSGTFSVVGMSSRPMTINNNSFIAFIIGKKINVCRDLHAHSCITF